MKVKYGDNFYEFKGDLNCLYFSNLIEEGIEEVELSMFENVFKVIFNDNLNFEEEKDYITLYQGLSYFGSKKEKELIDFLKKKIYIQEKKILQKEITDYFEETKYGIQYELCGNPSIPFDFLQKHFQDLENMTFVYENPSVPLDFFKEHINKIDWISLCKNPSIPLDFFKEHIDMLDIHCFRNLCLNPSISVEFYKELVNKTTVDTISWSNLCKNPSIPLEFFKKHLDIINWAHICENSSIPLEFFKEHLDRVIWSTLCRNPSIPLEFFKEHLDKINWTHICENISIPLEFFKEHSDKLNGLCWHFLSQNPSIPIEFFQEHILHISMSSFLQTNPNITINSLRKLRLDRDSMRNICKNHFNLEKRIRDKIKNTTYFDFKPLNDLVTK